MQLQISGHVEGINIRSGSRTIMLAAFLVLMPIAVLAESADATKYFTITVLDDQTGRGVPLVELRTVNSTRYYTDSNGVAAILEPGLTGQDVYFHVSSHGYEYPKDGFGYRGKRLHIVEGGQATLKIKRLNIAERLYRVTGGGIYRDSVLVGRPAPTAAPLLNGLVLGQDSVVNVIYRGKIHWFWGDTSWPAYPLGNFQVAGATSRPPADGGLPPDVGVNLTYFVDERGFAKQMAPIPGSGPTWIDGVITLRDAEGAERMFAVYAKVRQDMTAKGRGFLEYDNEAEQFRSIGSFDPQTPIQPGGHPFRHRVEGTDYVFYPRPFPVVRVQAEPKRLKDISQYECFTCLTPDSTQDELKLDRDEQGVLRWGWKREAPPLLPRQQEELLRQGRMKTHEARFRLHDVVTGKVIVVHGGSVYWNEYRQRWVMIALEIGGTSMLGEIWLVEADTPLGPWLYARKIVTHDRYSFYNPKQHPMFDEDGGRIIYFEGTYTHTFSGNPDKTPRYDYNQIMYRLDLSDPRTALPVPVYRTDGGGPGSQLEMSARSEDIAADHEPVFLALDRAIPGCVAVYERKGDDGTYRLEVGAVPEGDGDKTERPLFYALPVELAEPLATTLLLYEVKNTNSQGRRYTIEEEQTNGEGEHERRPLCRVWGNPRKMALPANP